jgi:dihydrofolate reductase
MRCHGTFPPISPTSTGRDNIVVSRNRGYSAPGCTVVDSLDAAWKAAGAAGEACVIGGTSLFREALPVADVIHLTQVEAEVPGDTFFPDFDRREWRQEEIARHAADARNAYAIRILRLERKQPRAD